jgi:hypothetical protein
MYYCPYCKSVNTDDPVENLHKCNFCGKMYTDGEQLTDVEVDLSEDSFLAIAKMAHERRITFNQMCIDLIKDALDRKEKGE